MDPTEILARLDDEESPPTDAELAEARKEFSRLIADAAANREIAEGTALRQARSLIITEIEKRADDNAKEEARAQALLEGIEEDLEDPEASEDEEVEEAEVEEEPADIDALEAIKLAARNRRASIDASAVPDNPYPNVQITGMGAAGKVNLDHNTRLADVAGIFHQYARGKNRGRDTFVRMMWEYPETRRLDGDTNANARIVDSVLAQATSFEAVAAAGGICGPLETVFDIPVVGSRGRPVRDALTRFGADRGGVRYVAAPRLSLDPVAGAVDVWTSANDASPSSPAEKPCPHIDCDEICEAQVDAITACLVVGNFQARFSSEQWASALFQLGLLHDRIAEQALLADIDLGSIAATYAAASGGTIGNVLGAVDRAVAGIRSRDRLSNATGFRLILDGWLRPALRSQFTVQAPAGTASALALADAQIDAYFATRGVTVSYTQDDAIFTAQTAGALNEFPSQTVLRIFPEGTWWFLDGGTLDLGTEIVDSTLIAQNDRQAFMETFEKAAKRTAPCDLAGDDSLSITVDVDDACLDACVATSP